MATKIIKEIVTDVGGNTTIEYSDDTVQKYNVADVVTAQTNPVTGGIDFFASDVAVSTGTRNSKLSSALRAHYSGLRARPPVILGIGDSNFTGEGGGDSSGYNYLVNAWANAPMQRIKDYLPTLNGCVLRNTAVFGEGNSGNTGIPVAQYDPRITLGAGWNREGGVGPIGGQFFICAQGTGGYFQLNFGSMIDTVELHFPLADGISASVGVYDSANNLIGSYSGQNATNAVGTATFTSATFADGIVKVKNNGAAQAYMSGMIAYNSTEKSVIVATASWSSGTASNYADVSGGYTGCAQIDAIQPDMTITALTINDIAGGTASATYNTAMAVIAAKAALYGDVLLSTGFPQNHANMIGSPSIGQLLELELSKVASVYNCRTASMHKEFGSWTAADTAGFARNSNHQTKAGYARLANAYAQIIKTMV